MLDNRKPALLPEDVVDLLKYADDATARQSWVTIPPYQLRELLTVWLRVAAFHEVTAAHPELASPGELAQAQTLLFGSPSVPDTEPNHEVPVQ